MRVSPGMSGVQEQADRDADQRSHHFIGQRSTAYGMRSDQAPKRQLAPTQKRGCRAAS